MCGIVGKIDLRDRLVEPDMISRSVQLLRRRGPDDGGVWTERNVGLGHRRLSVLDVTSAAHQPMISGEGRYVIVHNGEIYNFRELREELDSNPGSWQSRSDTEVILAAYDKWGPDCVTFFHGMFAFAIWDRQKEVLFAARDRMGVKPFYYHCSPACFAFASRSKALLKLAPAVSREIDEQGLRFYLGNGYIPAPYSIYQDIRKLPPAHYLLLDRRGLRLERYWDFRHIKPELSWEKRREEDLLDELEEIVNRSVRSRMVSDVPIGAFLSGGIDSSLVAAIMSKYAAEPVKTFTIGFTEKVFNESPDALAVSKHLGTEHHCEYLKVDDLLALMDIFCEEYDEPFFDGAAFPTMALSRLARKHVTVSLSGDGGDELFGGYHYYRIIHQLNVLFRASSGFRKGLAFLAGGVSNHKSKLLAGALRQPDISSAFVFLRGITKDFQEVLFPEILKQTQSTRNLFLSTGRAFPEGLHPSERGMRLDAFHTLVDDYLQKVDVASMAFSLESRDPLLDQDLVEWAMKLPLSWKLRRNQNKYLLRKLTYRYVPRQILDRPKHGFNVPIDTWLRGPLKSWALDRCNDVRLFKNIPLDQSKVIDLLKLHTSGIRNASPQLWAILIFLNFVSEKIKDKGV